jgi:zinc protease
MRVPFEKRTLGNGLDVIVHEDHRVPLVAVSVWYHVGSRNERPGKTGFAHLFEHLMFEGSEHHRRSYFEPLQSAAVR